MIMEQVQSNFKSGHYPAITRTLISFMGVKVNQNLNDPQTLFHAKFTLFVSQNYLNLHQEHPEMALDILPTGTHFDSSSKTLVQTGHRGTVTKLSLES